MKRDPDLIREILLQVEAADAMPLAVLEIELEGYSQNEISYHIQMLAEAQYLRAKNFTTLNSYEWKAQSLTWEGHELLGAIKDDTVWNDTKKQMSKIGGWTVAVLQGVATDIVKRHVGL